MIDIKMSERLTLTDGETKNKMDSGVFYDRTKSVSVSNSGALWEGFSN